MVVGVLLPGGKPRQRRSSTWPRCSEGRTEAEQGAARVARGTRFGVVWAGQLCVGVLRGMWQTGSRVQRRAGGGGACVLAAWCW